jgi:hypothetical protein
LVSRCREVAPLAEVHRVNLPPVVGAALLGLDAIGASQAAELRLRAHYSTESALSGSDQEPPASS